jgi:hypothetical protein
MEKVVRIYNSFQEEEIAHYARLSAMTIPERINEFEILQKRFFGEQWSNRPIVKQASVELLKWSEPQ